MYSTPHPKMERALMQELCIGGFQTNSQSILGILYLVKTNRYIRDIVHKLTPLVERVDDERETEDKAEDDTRRTHTPKV